MYCAGMVPPKADLEKKDLSMANTLLSDSLRLVHSCLHNLDLLGPTQTYKSDDDMVTSIKDWLSHQEQIKLMCQDENAPSFVEFRTNMNMTSSSLQSYWDQIGQKFKDEECKGKTVQELMSLIYAAAEQFEIFAQTINRKCGYLK